MPHGARCAWLFVFVVACHAGPLGAPPAAIEGLPGRDTAADRSAATARDLIDRGSPRAALTQIEEILAKEPRHVDARRLRQDLLRERGRRGVVWYEAERGVDAAPDDAVAHYLFGRMIPGREAKLSAFTRAATLAPELVWPWLGLAHSLRVGDPAQAIDIYERLYAASSGHPLIAVAYAAVLRENDRAAAAAAVYERLRGDARAPGVGALGLAQLAVTRDDRAAAWRALLDALRERPFDAAAQGLVLGWLESGASDDQVGQLIDVLREDPARLRELARGDGVVVAALLLQRTGQLQAMRSLLEANPPSSRQPALRRLQRRLLLGLGDVAAFLAIVRADVPLDVVDREPNRLRGRWLSLLQGPWHDGDPLATAAQSVQLLESLRAVGLLHEVELAAAAAERRWPAAAAAFAVLRDDARRELAFEAGVRRLLYVGYQHRDPAGLEVVLGRLRELSVRVLGSDVVGAPPVFSAPLVGEMIDPLNGPLAAHFDRYNRHFVLGRRTSGTAEGLLLTRLSLAELPESADLALPGRCFEVIGFDRDVRALGGVIGGDLAGVALLNHFLVDHDAVREWAHDIAERRRIAAEDGNALADDPLPREAGGDPLDVSWRLALLSPVQDTELDAAVLDAIRHHERQHLVDSFYYLPIENNLWRGLGLAFSFGFSPSAIEAEMERRAELAALALSPHTELVLAHIADFMGEGSPSSPHHDGFTTLGHEISAALQEAGVPPDSTVPSRWHLVPREVIRATARGLLELLP